MTETSAAARSARREALEEAAKIALHAHLVPPDGGSPSEDERLVAQEAHNRIMRLVAEEGPHSIEAPTQAAHGNEPVQAETVLPTGWKLVPESALEWLFGSGPDADGKWFGESQEALDAKSGWYPKRYWWRSKFRKMIDAAAPPSPSKPISEESIAKAIEDSLTEHESWSPRERWVTPWPTFAARAVLRLIGRE